MSLPGIDTCDALVGLFEDSERFDVVSVTELDGVPTQVVVEDTVAGGYVQVSWAVTEYENED